jgi:CPA2 family monovalent cation:H+ antiporter-2
MNIMEFNFLTSLAIILGVSALVVFLLHKLKIPSIVGFLVAGVIIGPHGVGLVRDTHSVEVMAEIGVILLLFTIGIEFSIAKLLRMKKAVIVGGGLQVLLTILFASIASYVATGGAQRSIFFGFLVALSSTAIVMKILAEKGETDSPHGRIMVGILIFQDLCVIPLMLLTPALAGEGIGAAGVMAKMGKALFIVATVLFSAKWVIPRLLHQVVSTKSRELFTITIILLCFGIALLTSRFGLSLALGAFLAGLIISESEYAHQATSDILPFKDSFIGLFFVSVGMLMDFGYVISNSLSIVVVVALILALKVITGTVSAFMAGGSLRVSLQAGQGLVQIGEFSFVLAVTGKEMGIITEEFYQSFLSSSVITMLLTPFIINAAPSISGWVTSRHSLRRLSRLRSEREGHPRKREDHVIIIGFGLNGRNLAKVLKEIDIPYVILEVNSDTVRDMKTKGEPIYYGDGTSREILHKLSIDRARLLVVAISDPASTRAIVSIARHENPDLHIIVRTRYLAEVDDLKSLGANEVIPEEFETSVEIFSRVLQQYNFPNNMILEMVHRVRSGSYTALRKLELPRSNLFEQCEWLPGMEVDGYRVAEDSLLSEKTIAQLQVRKKTGVTIIAVRRGAEVFANPEPHFTFKQGDIILFTGGRESMHKASTYFKSGAISSMI